MNALIGITSLVLMKTQDETTREQTVWPVGVAKVLEIQNMGRAKVGIVTGNVADGDTVQFRPGVSMMGGDDYE